MTYFMPSLTVIRDLLNTARTIAVVGLSAKENRPSNQVARYLLAHGYQVIPVNPGQDAILGQPCYPDLLHVPKRMDIVDIFRRSDQVEPVVREAVAIGAGAVWMQQGIVNQVAARFASEAGLIVIMDRCIMVDHQKVLVSG